MKFIPTFFSALFVLMAGWSFSVSADDTKIAALEAKLKPLFGGQAPDSLTESKVPGLYQAAFGMELIYVSEDGRYFITGDMIDGKTRSNLTENVRTGARIKALNSLDGGSTITYKAEDEKHVLAVFTDVTCPYCSKLHAEVPKLNELGVTVKYYAYPRQGPNSGAYRQMVSAWCADDKQDALTKLKNRESIPNTSCENPVKDHFALGRKIGVTGTPALVTETGVMIPGYRPAEALKEMLDELGQEAS